MRFWAHPMVINLLTLVALIGVGALLPRLIPRLRRAGIPTAIVAGLLGLALGPSALDVLPVDTGVLEVIVYHSFAVVFIAVGLQAAPRTRARGTAASLAVSLPMIGALQALLGFGLVVGWLALTSDALHPGMGWMVTLGFMQGPGQALALGSAWEGHGLVHGGQIGLVFAALGFGYCVLLGVPMVWIGRRRGWIEKPAASPADEGGEGTIEARAPAVDTTSETPSQYEPLTGQILLVTGTYLATFAVLYAVSSLLPEGSPVRSTIWGFHFIVGAALAIFFRRTARRRGGNAAFDDDLLARISVVAVEITTAGAIAAVRLDVLGELLGPILTMTAIAGGLTLIACVWLAKRAFTEDPFGHLLVLFGAGTGTISTGLALLRLIDPELKGPVARNVVIAATASVPLGAPLFLGLIPFAVSLWGRGWGTAVAWPIGLLVAYVIALAVIFKLVTPVKLLRPLTSLWPDR